MFDQFFGKLSAVVHHKAAPYAAERERFLEHCIQEGYTRDWIKGVAARLLVAAYELHTHGGLRASPEEIEAAADRVQRLRSDLHRPGDAQEYRESFVRVTTQWLAFIGCLQVPAVRPRPFSGLIDDFAQWMAQERGLSPETIQNQGGREETTFCCGRWRSVRMGSRWRPIRSTTDWSLKGRQ